VAAPVPLGGRAATVRSPHRRCAFQRPLTHHLWAAWPPRAADAVAAGCLRCFRRRLVWISTAALGDAAGSPRGNRRLHMASLPSRHAAAVER